ncbi:hypothetical protein TIFTF001_027651 [Ficus carica]|uniref:Uncharacterized protein n=1 Tax=Ficus carica TaxID=3494 RepID=A0AA88DPN7_FICCA|nr:hypothetical protein TIFTF001_025964 [Ficus carica]GMN58559.1 hypothetical protein TIFTF001_027651 [Ficus carica]
MLLLAGTDNVICDATTCHPLVSNLLASDDQSAVLAIQITVFPNCGFSIGITYDHVVLDGKSFVTFVKSWTHICRSLGVGIGGDVHDDSQSRSCLPADHKPFYDRTIINDPAKLESIFSNKLLNFGGPNNRIKALGIKDKKVVLRFPVDCRCRLEPPLPRTYFGNCVTTGFAVVETEFLLGKEGFSVAVNAISEAIKGLDNGVLDGAGNWVSGLMGNTSTPALGYVFPVASSRRFGF